MGSEWDPAKDATNLEKHGIGFDDADAVFEDPDVVEEECGRPEHGERRFKAIGNIDGVTFAVIFTMRGGRRRIISARRAARNERTRYGRGETIG